MSEFSAEDIQRAADKVSRDGFGDFMFMGPGRQNSTTSSQLTSLRTTTRRSTSGSRQTSQNNPSRDNRRCSNTGWRKTTFGNTQTKRCWENGNMWELKVRKRK